MTQDEYNKLTDEEQTALDATEVLGWESGDTYIPVWFDDGRALINKREYDPKHNLDHAFMLVDKMEEEGFRWELYKGVTRLPYSLQLFKGFVIFKGRGETKNKAIRLACLKAKGVVE